MLKLISATPSPYARKVRIALAEKSIPFELITEVPWDSTTATPEHNPLEKLPVLILPSDSSTGNSTPSDPRLHPTAVYESHHIMEYIEDTYPDPPLLPTSPAARLFARRVEVVADGVCDAGVLGFFERQREPARRSPEWEARQRRKIDGGLRALDEWVRGAGEGAEFMLGDKLGLADIATVSAVGWIKIRWGEMKIEERFPALAKYCARLEERESFRTTRPSPQTMKDKVV